MTNASAPAESRVCSQASCASAWILVLCGCMFLLSLTATCQVCTVSLKAGQSTYKGPGADCLQRPLVPRSRFRQRLTPSVRVSAGTSRHSGEGCKSQTVKVQPTTLAPSHAQAIGNGVGEALTGERAGRVWSPAIGLVLGADALRTRGRPHASTPLWRGGDGPGGVGDLWHATETRCAEPGRPCLWPGEGSPGPHGAPTGHDRDGRVQGVGPLQSTEEAFAQRSPQGTGGAGGGKGAGQGERGGANQEPDTAPGSPVTGAQPRTAGPCGCLHVRPEAGARCGSAARRDLCGGCRVTGIPTATVHW